MYVIFTRKPRNLNEVEQNMQYLRGQEWVEITEEIKLTPEQYNFFWNNPLSEEHDYLRGKGGYQKNQWTAVLLVCDSRKPIVVDPSGYAYGRYVGFEVLKTSG